MRNRSNTILITGAGRGLGLNLTEFFLKCGDRVYAITARTDDGLQQGTRKQIVSISSEAGSIAQSQRKSEYSYCMSKAALNMGMKVLSNRLKPEGITVQLIHPGWVRTDMGGKAAHLSPEEAAEAVAKQILEYNNGPMYIDWQGKELPW